MLAALAFVRFVHFFGLLLAFGAAAFLALLAPAVLRRALDGRIARLVAWGCAVTTVSALGWLALEAASMVGDWSSALDPQTLWAVMLDTDFGDVWLVRLALLVMLIMELALRRGEAWATTTVLLALLLASLAGVGHAAEQDGVRGWLQRANHAVHLLAAGAWLGGLIPFALTLSAYRDPALTEDAVTAMRRFSRAGHVFVAAVVVTGVVNIALVSGVGSLTNWTPYRALLLSKIVLVAAMIGLAFVNRYVLTPRLKREAGAFDAMRRNCVVEVVLGAGVVGLVSVFALLEPASKRTN